MRDAIIIAALAPTLGGLVFLAALGLATLTGCAAEATSISGPEVEYVADDPSYGIYRVAIDDQTCVIVRSHQSVAVDCFKKVGTEDLP